MQDRSEYRGFDLDEMPHLWVATATRSPWVEICLWLSLQLKGSKGEAVPEALFIFYCSSFHDSDCVSFHEEIIYLEKFF